jgi:hypothetical protein
LTELQVEVCTAYKGPKQFYPDVCKEIVGEQKEYEPDIAQEEDHPAPPVVNEESKVPKPQEDEKVKEETSKTDKVRLEFFWRAFW